MHTTVRARFEENSIESQGFFENEFYTKFKILAQKPFVQTLFKNVHAILLF